MYMFTVFLLNVDLFCFIRQLPLNFTSIFLLIYSSFGAKMLLFIVGDLITSSNNPLDFHDKILLVLAIFLKYLLNIGLNIKKKFLQDNRYL